MSKLGDELNNAIISYGSTFVDVERRFSSLLEIGAMLLTVQHYEMNGYQVSLIAPSGKFSPKYASTGDPRKYSYWKVCADGECFEIHMNAPIWDGVTGNASTFVVDVGVINENSQIIEDHGEKLHTTVSKSGKHLLRGFENKNLVTFIEAKYLPIYPMLVAQFIGIVHEIMPWALVGRAPHGFRKFNHFDPALVSRGKLSANVERLLSLVLKRKFRIRIIPSFEKYVEGGHFVSKRGASILGRDPKGVVPKLWWLK